MLEAGQRSPSRSNKPGSLQPSKLHSHVSPMAPVPHLSSHLQATSPAHRSPLSLFPPQSHPSLQTLGLILLLPQIRGAAPLCAALAPEARALGGLRPSGQLRWGGRRGAPGRRHKRGRDPGCSCPARGRDKGPAGGPLEPFSCLLGLGAGNVAPNRADQQSRARRRVGCPRFHPPLALC